MTPKRIDQPLAQRMLHETLSPPDAPMSTGVQEMDFAPHELLTPRATRRDGSPARSRVSRSMTRVEAVPRALRDADDRTGVASGLLAQAVTFVRSSVGLRSTRPADIESAPVAAAAAPTRHERLARQQKFYAQLTTHRPVNLEAHQDMLDALFVQLAKPEPGNRGWAPVNALLDGGKRLGNRMAVSTGRAPPFELPDRRDMTEVLDHFCRMLSIPKDQVSRSYAKASMIGALPGLPGDAVQTVLLGLGYAFGGSKAGAATLTAAQIATLLVLPYFTAKWGQRFYAYNELTIAHGDSARSKPLRKAVDLDVTRGALDDWERKAASLPALDALSSPDEVEAAKSLREEGEALKHQRYVKTADDNPYFTGQQYRTMTAMARAIALTAVPALVRKFGSKGCDTSGLLLGLSIATIWFFRALAFAATAKDGPAKKWQTHMSTLEVTGIDKLSDVEEVRNTWRSSAALRRSFVEVELQGRAFLEMGKLARLLGVNVASVQALERAGGFHQEFFTGDLGEVDRTPLDEFNALSAADLKRHDDVSRERMSTLVRLAILDGPLSAEEKLERKALAEVFEVSTMSGAHWKEFDEQEASGRLAERQDIVGHLQVAARSPAVRPKEEGGRGSFASFGSIPSLDLGLQAFDGAADRADHELLDAKPDELARRLLPTRAAESLTPREHTRLLMLQARRTLPQNGELRFALPDVDHAEFRQIATAQKAVRELERRGRVAGQGPRHDAVLAEARRIVQDLADIRLDEKMLGPDWNKTSEPVQQRLDDLFGPGKSIVKMGNDAYRFRKHMGNLFTPWLISRYAPQWTFGIAGTNSSFTIGAAGRLYVALHPEASVCIPGEGLSPHSEHVSNIRIALSFGALMLTLLNSVSGVHSKREKDIRRLASPSKDNPGKDIPSTTTIFLTKFPKSVSILVPMELRERYLGMRQMSRVDKALARLHAELASLIAQPSVVDRPMHAAAPMSRLPELSFEPFEQMISGAEVPATSRPDA